MAQEARCAEWIAFFCILENGLHSIELVDLKGSVMNLGSWNVTTSGSRQFDFTFDTSVLADGEYFLVLKSPTNSKTAKLLIQK